METLDLSIMVILGSENDFEKLGGKEMVEEKLKQLKWADHNFSASVSVISCHRNPLELLEFCRNNKAQLWIGVAGKAAALPGIINAHLHALKKPAHVVGIGISSDNEKDHLAARLSITQLPGEAVGFMGYDREGFDNALKFYELMADGSVKEVRSKEPQINIIHVK